MRVVEREDRPTLLLRAAGSAGGRFPLELYVSARGVDGLADGVHWYDPVAHALLQVGPPAAGEATTLVVTGVPWRTAGATPSAASATSTGTPGRCSRRRSRSGGSSRGCGRASRTPRSRGSSAPTACTSSRSRSSRFGDGEPAIRPRGEAAAGAVDAAPREFPLVTLAQHAGDADVLGDPWPAAAPLAGEPPASPRPRRRDPAARLDAPDGRLGDRPREVFEFSLAASLRGIDVPHFVAVHGVEGVEPGLYRWPDLDRPLRRGLLREELLRVCWDQDLGRDAAFVVIAATDIDRLDDRGYREAQLAAGLVEGRLHLAAYALGIGASGMTFLDSEIAGLLGEPLAGLLFTCVGVPDLPQQGRRAAGRARPGRSSRAGAHAAEC